MSNQVRVSSIDALEAFRSELIQYITKARVALEDMTSENRRTRDWLDHDRTNYWNAQIRRRTKLLEQAEQELYSANLTSPLASNALQKMAVTKAKRLVVEAEEKMRILNEWRKRFDRLSSPPLRQLDPLFGLLSQNLPQGVVSLGETIKALQAYAEQSPPPVTPPPEPEATA
jgi:hypothetical protein